MLTWADPRYVRHRCNDCHYVYARHENERIGTNGNGVPVWKQSCPECGCARYEEIVVCVECLKRDPVAGDDVCKECCQLEDDKEADMVLDQIDERAKERQRDEFTKMLIDIVSAPWRKQA